MLPVSDTTVEEIASLLASRDALPEEIISPSLRQRHTIIGLSIDDDQINYLCWPEPDGRRLSPDSLNALINPRGPFNIRYAADSESGSAHIQIGNDLRLVLHWDSYWKYHNLTRMPFPSASYPSVEEAVEKANTSCPTATDDDDDDYWSSYPYTGTQEPVVSPPAEDNEDAYWAQYASVQGSADSTVPSPKRKKGENQAQYYYANEEMTSSESQPTYHDQEQLSSFQPEDNSMHSQALSTRLAELQLQTTLTKDSTNSDAAVRQAIDGIYKLWHQGKNHNPQEFLHIVAEVVNHNAS